MALYMLLTKERVSQDEFCEIVQGLSPYHDITYYDGFIDEYKAGDVIQNDIVTLPGDIDADLMIKREAFEKHFKNQKSKSAIVTYYEFYQSLYAFIDSHSADNLHRMLSV